MDWTVEIYDPSSGLLSEVTDRVLQVTTDERLDSENNTFKVTCKNIDQVHKFNKIYIKKGIVLKFAGFIINQTDQEIGTMKITTFSCFDWSYVFNNRIVPETYDPSDAYLGRPDLIIKDLVSKHAPEFTTINVDACSTILDRMQFRYVMFLEAMTKILENIPTFHYYVDAAKDVHFFENFETIGVTFDNSSGAYNFRINTLSVEYIGEDQVNRLWIIGNKQPDTNYIDQYYTGDGVQRYFSLAYEPNNTQIYVGAAPKLSKLVGDNDGAQDFLIDRTNKVIYIPPNIATPFNGTIKVHYSPTKQPIDYYENAPNIAAYGLYEKVIKNNDIVDRLTARQYARAQVKRRSTARRILSFETQEDVAIGQKCYVNIVVVDAIKGNWNIAGYFLVLSVSTSITAVNGTVDLFNSVKLEEIV